MLRALASGALQGARIALVVSNKEDAPILERARQHGIRALHVPVQGRSREAYDAAVTSALEAAGVQAVLLVGYMRILSAQFCERWAKRCVNIHPSLLPAFAGGMDLQVHEAVLAAGAKETGCTVHYVEAEVDAGAPVVQRKCAVQPDDTPLSLKARVQALEGPALCDAVSKLVADVRAGRDAAVAASTSSSDGTAAAALTYASAGVSIDAGNALVDDIKPLAKATNRAGVMGSIGGFGGLFDTRAAGYKDPVLVSGTDGVGTKLIIAQATGKHGSIGIDLVAMVVNDLIVQGAEPLFFLDYFASGALDVKCAGEVVGGIARGCAACGCALVGGETAEMPGMYAPGHYDLAGFAVGAVERADILPRLEEIAPGDVRALVARALPSRGRLSHGRPAGAHRPRLVGRALERLLARAARRRAVRTLVGRAGALRRGSDARRRAPHADQALRQELPRRHEDAQGQGARAHHRRWPAREPAARPPRGCPRLGRRDGVDPARRVWLDGWRLARPRRGASAHLQLRRRHGARRLAGRRDGAGRHPPRRGRDGGRDWQA